MWAILRDTLPDGTRDGGIIIKHNTIANHSNNLPKKKVESLSNFSMIFITVISGIRTNSMFTASMWIVDASTRESQLSKEYLREQYHDTEFNDKMQLRATGQ
jgi:hypothetical protein